MRRIPVGASPSRFLAQELPASYWPGRATRDSWGDPPAPFRDDEAC